ncbi:hypothetical protein GQ607_010530 [Colletotrichum asianum]|uniref:Uncharacterized protein n=1 Tax=Colletotrichum asianum TaxID=702518 RepID=A0A8H3ZQB8_9PEZI|nr:hypothetical protein GQ607_010530 [Colletotrichum asianum]
MVHGARLLVAAALSINHPNSPTATYQCHANVSGGRWHSLSLRFV